VLYLETIHPETQTLLRSMVLLDQLQSFALAGGTGLALYLGHRVSIDLDFFTRHSFDGIEMFEFLKECYEVSNCSGSANSLSLFVQSDRESVKVDMLRHNYRLLQPIRVIDAIPLFSLEDIAAMKMNAIANRGAKKDFFDIHALLQHFTLQELLNFFEQKYEQLNSFTVLKSLVFFVDAENDPDPMSLQNVSWHDLKENLRKLVAAIN